MYYLVSSGVNLNYNFEATLKAASLKLVMAQSQQDWLFL